MKKKKEVLKESPGEIQRRLAEEYRLDLKAQIRAGKAREIWKTVRYDPYAVQQEES